MEQYCKGDKIIEIYGILGEAWEDKDATYYLNIYSNSVVLTQPHTNKILNKYEFDNINQLKISAKAEVKKKFFINLKTFYLDISIDYTNSNKGVITIPTITCRENDYSNILLAISDYKARKEQQLKLVAQQVKAKEQEQINKLRVKQQLENLKSEFVNVMEFYDQFHFHMKMDSMDLMEKLEIKIDENLYYFLIKEMYCKIGDNKSINSINKDLNNSRFFKNLFDKSIAHDFNDQNPYFLGLVQGCLAGHNKYFVDEYIYKSFMNDEEASKIADEIISTSHYPAYGEGVYAFVYFNIIYMYAFCFIKGLVLFRNADKFLNNTELNTMYTNLRNNTKLQTHEIGNKLYPIYKSYYLDIFDKELSELEFNSFIFMLDKYCTETGIDSVNIYESEINECFNRLNENTLNYNENDNSSLISTVENLLKTIDNERYFNHVGTPYDLNYENIKGTYVMLYHNILKNISKHVPCDVFFKLYDNDKVKNVYLLLQKHQDEIVKKERDRLLRGDFEREKQKEIDDLSFRGIKSGYDFEEYLRIIFKKLGYKVEITKKSNDQGGDLIIVRGNERTVVQAKYYSNPVGNKAIQEVFAAISFYKANKGMVVTNSTFTSSAVALAEVNGITLVDGEELSRIRDSIIETIA
jgi:HJR/Mrr/RecB family endonuclease